MLDFLRSWLAVLSDRRGLTALDYGALAGLVAAVAVAAMFSA